MAHRQKVMRYYLIGDQDGNRVSDILRKPLENIGCALNYRSDNRLAETIYKQVIQVASSELIESGFQEVPAEMDVKITITVESVPHPRQ